MDEKEITYTSPIYLQLREVIRTKIEEGEYHPRRMNLQKHTESIV